MTYILCSIDGIGERFEYIRFPGKWSKVEKNLLDFKESNFNCVIVPSIGLHNILYLDEIIDWSKQNNFDIDANIVWGSFSLTNFPFVLKENLLEYIHSLPNFKGKDKFVNEAESINNTNLGWVDYLDRLDAIRGNNWKQSLNKLYDLLKIKDIV